MGTTVEDALNKLLGAVVETPQGPGIEDTDLAGLIKRANELWTEAQSQLRNGDWAGYGRTMDELGRLLKELQSTETGLS